MASFPTGSCALCNAECDCGGSGSSNNWSTELIRLLPRTRAQVPNYLTACDRKEAAMRILACGWETHPTRATTRERTSMSFLRHEEIYRSDVGTRRDREQRTLSLLPALIGFDEFPVGYSLAGCPPAEPASASPTRNYSPQSTLSYNYLFRRVCSVTFLHEATRGEIIVDAGHTERSSKGGQNGSQLLRLRRYRLLQSMTREAS
jgi:hypothetical protein